MGEIIEVKPSIMRLSGIKIFMFLIDFELTAVAIEDVLPKLLTNLSDLC